VKRNIVIWWSVFAVCLTAFVTIAVLVDQIFEQVPHSEDEVAYIFQAKVFAQNRLTVPTPQNSDAFWTPFVVDYQGQRFGKYPPGWPLFLSLGVRLGAPWLINTFLATLTLFLIAWLGKCFYEPKIGLWAAGLGLVTPGFLFLSSSLLSHTSSLFWTTLVLVALFYSIPERGGGGDRREFNVIRKPTNIVGPPYAPRGHPLYATSVGLALGAAFITRPFAALGIGLAVGIFLLILMVRHELKWTGLLWLMLGFLPIAALLPLYWWTITGDPTFNPYLLVWPYDRVGFGPNVGAYGYSLHNAVFINTRLKLTVLATGLFGWPGWSSLLFLPLPFLFRRTNRWDWLLLGTILGMIFVHLFYWAFGGVDGGFPRYYYDALPALLLLTVRGIQISSQYLGHWQFTRLSRFNLFRSKPVCDRRSGVTDPLRARNLNLLSLNLFLTRFRLQLSWLPIGLVISFIVYNLIWNLPPLLAAQKGKYDITPAPLQVVEQANLSKPTLVMVKNVEIWNVFAAPFAANSPTLDGPVVYAIDWGPALTQQVREQFKERTCWELEGEILRRCY
jgi:4-amino-4-deoxy-L-arabinose transferase-like glycosyltransferase